MNETEQLYQTEKVPMTSEDRERMNAEHVQCQLELEAVKEEKSEVSSVYRVKIRELEEKIHTLAAALDEGAYDRKFEVIEEPDDARSLVSILRKETHELIDTRPMTEVEKEAARKRKQGNLFDEDRDSMPPEPKLPKLRGVGAIGRSRSGRVKKKNGR